MNLVQVTQNSLFKVFFQCPIPRRGFDFMIALKRLKDEMAGLLSAEAS